MKISQSLATVCLLSLGLATQAATPASVFDSLTNRQNWTWKTFQNLPKASGDSNGISKDQNAKGRYYLARSLGGVQDVTAYGSQSAPNVVVFYSGGWGTQDENSLLKLSDVVNTNNLTKLNSTCNFGKVTDSYKGKDSSGHRFSGTNYIDYQTVYKWSQAGRQPLYVVALKGGGWVETSVFNQGLNASVIVTPDYKALGSIIARHGWHKNNAGKLVSCKVS